MTKIGIIVAAGGSSVRFAGGNKLLAPLAGMPLLCHCLRTFGTIPDTEIIIATAPEAQLPCRQVVAGFLPELHSRLRWCDGGACRSRSVQHALQALAALPAPPEIIAVHDGARPHASAELLRRCVAAVEDGADGAIVCHAVTDTIHMLSGGEDSIHLAQTLPRQRLIAAETPQVFRRQTLERAFAAWPQDAPAPTDEAQLVMALPGCRIVPVFNDAPNPKITYRHDLA